jgi:hypothetical protein
MSNARDDEESAVRHYHDFCGSKEDGGLRAHTFVRDGLFSLVRDFLR